MIPETIQEYGYVHRIQKSEYPDTDHFIQDNFYYLCQAEEALKMQDLDDYEADESFTLEWMDPETVILINRNVSHGPKDQNMLEREARVLEILMQEGYFN